jgi:WD40 repeat protein
MFMLRWLLFIGVCLLVCVPVSADDITYVVIDNPDPRAIYGITWKPDSTQFLRYTQAFGEAPAILVDAQTGTVLKQFEKIVSTARWSADEKQLIVLGEETAIFDASTLEKQLTLDINVQELASVSPDTRLIYDSDAGRFRIYDLHSGQHYYDVPGLRAYWTPDSTLLVVVHLKDRRDSQISIYDAQSGVPLAEYYAPFPDTISPDGRRFLATSPDGINIYDLMTGSVVSRLFPHVDNGRGCSVPEMKVSWSPNGTYLLVPDLDGTMRIWNVETEMTLHVLEAENLWIENAYWSDSGQYVLGVASGNRAAVIWDRETGNEILRIETGLEQGDRASAIWSEDESIIMFPALNGITALYNSRTGEHLADVQHHVTVAACGVTFVPPVLSPDGSKIVTYYGGDQIGLTFEVGSEITSQQDIPIYSNVENDVEPMRVLAAANHPVVEIREVVDAYWLRVRLSDGSEGYTPTLYLRPYLPLFENELGWNMLVWLLPKSGE